MRRIIGSLMTAAGISLILFLGITYGPHILQYWKAANEYQEIRDTAVTEQELDSSLTDWMKDLGIDPSKKLDVLDVDGKALYEQNHDYIGWIYVPGTPISYPAVMSKDNSDYLHTGFDRGYLFSGTVFMDYRCTDGYLNRHSILYGHNMNDGSMFASLNKFSDAAYFKEHPYFWFITQDYKLLYSIFSVTYPSPTDTLTYGVTYKDTADFLSCMQQIQDNSLVQTDYVLDDSDYVMTLSTCTGNSATRCTVHGVLLGAYKEKKGA